MIYILYLLSLVHRADSIFEVRTKLPDSITSWVTRAVVVSPSSGLHIPDVTQVKFNSGCNMAFD